MFRKLLNHGYVQSLNSTRHQNPSCADYLNFIAFMSLFSSFTSEYPIPVFCLSIWSARPSVRIAIPRDSYLQNVLPTIALKTQTPLDMNYLCKQA